MIRIKNDFYPTPSKLTEKLVSKINPTGIILEPCVGDGDIAIALPEHCYVVTNDIDREKEADTHEDASAPLYWQSQIVDWVITNPPFNQASEILPLAWARSRVGCAFLLRITYLEPTQKRRDWMIENVDHLQFILPVNPRVRFRKDSKGTDSTTVAWFVWRKDFSWEELGIDCPFSFLVNWEK